MRRTDICIEQKLQLLPGYPVSSSDIQLVYRLECHAALSGNSLYRPGAYVAHFERLPWKWFSVDLETICETLFPFKSEVGRIHNYPYYVVYSCTSLRSGTCTKKFPGPHNTWFRCLADRIKWISRSCLSHPDNMYLSTKLY